MEINVLGQHLSLGDSLREYVTERIEKSVHKFFEQAISAEVHLIKENRRFKCNIIVNEGTKRHMIIRANAESYEVYSAFDLALVRIEQKLRKYKTKIKNHHKKSITDLDDAEINMIQGTKYTLSHTHDEVEHDDHQSLIIAEKPTSIDKLTVAEAVMRMELHEVPALVFINKANNRLNVVYHRHDGNISWVDPAFK